jgi:signal recognition particle subunit SRP54
MFESLSNRLSSSFEKIAGVKKLTDENMKEPLKKVKNALIEADVAFPVVKELVNEIRDLARGQEVKKSINPGQTLIKVVNDILTDFMGSEQADLNLASQPPAIILVAGLQGSGKTTSCAKLAVWLKERMKKSALLVSCDVYRPAAIEQLRSLAEQTDVDFFASESKNPIEIASDALKHAQKTHADVLIVDTAGRLHIDDDMMQEIKMLHQRLDPIETLFVVDGMTGQDAANTAKAFDSALPLTGVVVTKLDGDARGGAVLSIKKITGKPIKFVGMGEKVDALEPFYPDRMASRILGMGDILSLVEELERKVDKVEAEKLAKKLNKGKGFDLEDFAKQLQQMQDMGGMSKLMDKLPGMGKIPEEVKNKANDKSMSKMLAIIQSMTLKERKKPILVQNSGSRKRRIALGSGSTVQAVMSLLKQYNQMQKMMKKMGKKGGLTRMMNQMKGVKGMEGMLPPGGGMDS